MAMILKVEMNGDVRRFPLELPEGSDPQAKWQLILDQVRSGYRLPEDSDLTLRYRDDEGDLCTLIPKTLPDCLALAAGGPLKLFAGAPAAAGPEGEPDPAKLLEMIEQVAQHTEKSRELLGLMLRDPSRMIGIAHNFLPIFWACKGKGKGKGEEEQAATSGATDGSATDPWAHVAKEWRLRMHALNMHFLKGKGKCGKGNWGKGKWCFAPEPHHEAAWEHHPASWEHDEGAWWKPHQEECSSEHLDHHHGEQGEDEGKGKEEQAATDGSATATPQDPWAHVAKEWRLRMHALKMHFLKGKGKGKCGKGKWGKGKWGKGKWCFAPEPHHEAAWEHHPAAWEHDEGAWWKPHQEECSSEHLDHHHGEEGAAPKREAGKCPAGHELTLQKLPNGWCDACDARIAHDDAAVGCRECNWDLCWSCATHADADVEPREAAAQVDHNSPRASNSGESWDLCEEPKEKVGDAELAAAEEAAKDAAAQEAPAGSADPWAQWPQWPQAHWPQAHGPQAQRPLRMLALKGKGKGKWAHAYWMHPSAAATTGAADQPPADAGAATDAAPTGDPSEALQVEQGPTIGQERP